jgi:elongation factor G
VTYPGEIHRPFEPPAAPVVVSVVLTPATFADGYQLSEALAALKAADGAFEAIADAASGQVTIGATNELHLEIIMDRLAREYNVRAGVGRPQIVYRPALTCTADAQTKYARQTRERGQYGHVVIRLSPRPPAAGYLFEDHVKRGAVPAQYLPAIDDGIQHVLTSEGFAGHPISDVRVELLDGSYHDVDSSDEAFRSAAELATREAVRNAGLVLLEPTMRLALEVPPVHLDEVVKPLLSSGGRVWTGQVDGGSIAVWALAPMRILFAYEAGFRSVTLGRGTCTIQFAGYAPVPPADDDEELPIGVRLRRPPDILNSGVALPEPEEPGED